MSSAGKGGIYAAAVVVVLLFTAAAVAAAAVIYCRHRKSTQAGQNGKHCIQLY